MEERISINIHLFTINISKLKESVKKLETEYMSMGETLDKTNIKPFIDDLENMIRALELMKRYYEIFTTDLRVIQNIADTLREQDERLSIPKHDFRDGPQPIHL